MFCTVRGSDADAIALARFSESRLNRLARPGCQCKRPAVSMPSHREFERAERSTRGFCIYRFDDPVTRAGVLLKTHREFSSFMLCRPDIKQAISSFRLLSAGNVGKVHPLLKQYARK